MRRRCPQSPLLLAVLLAQVVVLLLVGAQPALAHEGEEHVGWDVRIVDAPRVAGEVAPLRFEVRTASGAPVTSYDLAHARKLHAWFVRTDDQGRATGYQHHHPSYVDGVWEIMDARFDSPGTWNLIVDATSRGVQGFGFAAFEVGGSAVVERPAPDNGYVARIISSERQADGSSAIRVRISDSNGVPATDLVEHIGAPAHWTSFVARARGVLGAAHAHAATGVDSDGVIEFSVQPPEGYVLADATGGWIELRTSSRGVSALPLRPSGVGARPSDGLLLRMRTAAAQAGVVDAAAGAASEHAGHDMAGMSH